MPPGSTISPALPIDDLCFTAHYYWQSRYLANMTGFDPSQRTGAYGLLNLRIDVLNVGGKQCRSGALHEQCR